jgi:gluconokinase
MPEFPPRSGYETVGGMVMFGRTLDKIRLHHAGLLPKDYDLGHGLDARICRFLNIDYQFLVAETLKDKTDEEILNECFTIGRKPSEEEILIFNQFMTKRGWRDDASEWLVEQKQKNGFAQRDEIQTAFDFHDADEGRMPKFPVTNPHSVRG